MFANRKSRMSQLLKSVMVVCRGGLTVNGPDRDIMSYCFLTLLHPCADQKEAKLWCTAPISPDTGRIIASHFTSMWKNTEKRYEVRYHAVKEQQSGFVSFQTQCLDWVSM